ncbi:hypothetical protein V6N12_055605 [Hibiscus sabdariffa]|uniref:Uncharacterized protein n=1 Tax=Hibiscus sabdariffa TaxID=183260 RepID=A0ABR2BU69_9ROSI
MGVIPYSQCKWLSRLFSPILILRFSNSNGFLFKCDLGVVIFPYQGTLSVSISVFGLDSDERRQRFEGGVGKLSLSALILGWFRWEKKCSILAASSVPVTEGWWPDYSSASVFIKITVDVRLRSRLVARVILPSQTNSIENTGMPTNGYGSMNILVLSFTAKVYWLDWKIAGLQLCFCAIEFYAVPTRSGKVLTFGYYPYKLSSTIG